MRRSDPERIFEAKRACLRGRMVAMWKVREADVDTLLDCWDIVATARVIARHDPRYWSEGEPWLRYEAEVSDDG